MKFIIKILFCLVLLPSFSQSDTINRVGADGKKYGYWIIYGKDRPESGFAPHTIIEEGKYESGKKTGLWKTYHLPNVLKSEIEYMNNRPNGKFITYYENGQIQEIGEWKGTGYFGLFKAYYENGCLKKEVNYHSMNKAEWYIYYYPSDTCGLIEAEYNRNGKKEFSRYNRKGVLTDTISKLMYYDPYESRIKISTHGPYINSKSVSGKNLFSYCECDISVSDTIYTYYESEFKIVIHGEFKDRKLQNGICSIYKNDSVFVESFTYVDGSQIARLKLDTQKNDLRQDYHKLYNSYKQITEDGFFKDGKMVDGKKYIYDKNGLLDKIEIYKNGKYVGDAEID